MSEPIPAASRPGSSTTPSIGPPSPAASISRNAPVMGDPSSEATAAKLPAPASTATPWAGTLAPPGGAGGQHGQAAAQGDQWHLGAEHGAEDQGRQRREDDPGKLNRGRRAMHGETARRRGPASPRQVLDGQAGQHATHSQHWQRPPHRFGGETEPVRKVGEDLLLQIADERQEAVGRGGDRHAQDRRQDQQPEVAPAAQQGHGVRRAGRTRRARLGRRARLWVVCGHCHRPIIAPAGMAAAHLHRVTSAPPDRGPPAGAGRRTGRPRRHPRALTALATALADTDPDRARVVLAHALTVEGVFGSLAVVARLAAGSMESASVQVELCLVSNPVSGVGENFPTQSGPAAAPPGEAPAIPRRSSTA